MESKAEFKSAVRQACDQLKAEWRCEHLSGRLEKTVRRIGRFALIVSVVGAAALAVAGFFIAIQSPAEDQGLTATYYSKPDFEGHPFQRIEHGVDLSWGKEPPVKGVKPSGFSMRLEGCLVVDPGAPTVLTAGSGFPVNVYLDGTLAIGKTDLDSAESRTATRPLQPGIHRLKIEYPRCKAYTRIALGWAGGAQDGPQAIPAANLVPLGGNAEHECKASNAGSSPAGERTHHRRADPEEAPKD